MADPKDRKDHRIASNAPDITDPYDDEENGEDLQEQVEDVLIEADEDMRQKRYNLDKDDTDITSNAPNITTDTPPSERDQRE